MKFSKLAPVAPTTSLALAKIAAGFVSDATKYSDSAIEWLFDRFDCAFTPSHSILSNCSDTRHRRDLGLAPRGSQTKYCDSSSRPNRRSSRKKPRRKRSIARAAVDSCLFFGGR